MHTLITQSASLGKTLAGNVIRSYRSEPKAVVTEASAVVDSSREKDLTVLVYAEGRDRLAPSTFRAINELEKSGSDESVNVVVQATSKPTAHDRHLPQFGSMPTRRYYVTRDDDTAEVTSPVVGEFETRKELSQETMTDFLKWGMTEFPAKQYLLIVKKHGLGFARSQGGVPLSARELGASLDEARQATGKSPSVVAFDSCLMQQMEVASELIGKTEVVVGSQESVRAAVYPYDPILSGLKQVQRATGEVSAGQIGQLVVKAHERFAPDSIQTAGDVKGVEQKALPALRSFVETALKAEVPRDLLYTHLIRSQSLEPYQSASLGYDFRDLDGFLKGVAEDSRIDERVRDVASEAREATRETVLSHHIDTVDKKLKNGTGWSVYLPWRKNSSLEESYSQLEFSKKTGWSKLHDYIFDESGPPAYSREESIPAKGSGVAHQALRAYKKYVSAYLPTACPYTPSCSTYAKDAIAQHGLAEGLELAFMRLVGCGGANAGGEDRVPAASRDAHSLNSTKVCEHGHVHSEADLPDVVLSPPVSPAPSGREKALKVSLIRAARMAGQVCGAVVGGVAGGLVGLGLGGVIGGKTGSGSIDKFNERIYQKYGEHKTARFMSLERKIGHPGDYVNRKVKELTGSDSVASVVGGVTGSFSGALLGAAGGALTGMAQGSRFLAPMAENATKDRFGLLPPHHYTERVLRRDYGG